MPHKTELDETVVCDLSIIIIIIIITHLLSWCSSARAQQRLYAALEQHGVVMTPSLKLLPLAA